MKANQITAEFESEVDKSKWGEGPWQHEPDHLIWTHAEHPCVVVRSPTLGLWRGYVGVEQDHPLFWKELPPDYQPELREGDMPADSRLSPWVWMLSGAELKHGPLMQPWKFWWFGFCCPYFGDFSSSIRGPKFFMSKKWKSGINSYRTFDFVKNQTEQLAEKLRDTVAKSG